MSFDRRRFMQAGAAGVFFGRNIFQAEECGCHIITVTNDILQKLSMVGKSLDELSLDTVKMFFNDAAAAGFTLWS